VAQYISNIITQAMAVQAVSGSNVSVGTLSIPAGEWLVDGELWCTVSSGTPTISTIAAALTVGAPLSGILSDPADNMAANVSAPMQTKQTGGTTVGWVLPLTSMYLNETTSTTVYLNGQLAWTTAGTLLLYGEISARGSPASVVQAYPNFLLVHSSTDARIGYINLNDVRWVVEEGAGSKIQVGDDQIWHVTETATYIASGGTQP
jgi:hypothetical protein